MPGLTCSPGKGGYSHLRARCLHAGRMVETLWGRNLNLHGDHEYQVHVRVPHVYGIGRLD